MTEYKFTFSGDQITKLLMSTIFEGLPKEIEEIKGKLYPPKDCFSDTFTLVVTEKNDPRTP